jgi:hypothetical protein
MQTQPMDSEEMTMSEGTDPEGLWGIVRCSNCSTVGYATDRYCPACGWAMLSRCPKCGAPVEHLIARFCTHCGAGLGGGETAESETSE